MDTGFNHDDANTPNLEQLMQLGIQTARQGNKQNARLIFQQILDIDKQNERAWLWMAAVAETTEDRIRYFNTVLRLNPNNPTVLRELEKIRKKRELSNNRAIYYGCIVVGAILLLTGFVIVLITIA